MTLDLVAYTLIVVAAAAGLALKDVRLHAATLAIAAVALVLLLAHVRF